MLPLKSSAQVIASGVTLTSSYSAHTILSVDEQNFLGLLVKYTKGDETSLQYKVDISVDGGTTWFQQTTETVSGGTITVAVAERTVAATGNYSSVIFPIKVPQRPTTDGKGLIRISTKATGGTPTGTVSITATVGWA